MPIANTGHVPNVDTPTKLEGARFFSRRLRIIITQMRKLKSLKVVLHAEVPTLIAQVVALCLTTDGRMVQRKNRAGFDNFPHIRQRLNVIYTF
jgi:hypothetical protein